MAFLCILQCTIATYDYVAVGNSTNKKDAQGNACKDMIQYLIRVGHVKENEAPNLNVQVL